MRESKMAQFDTVRFTASLEGGKPSRLVVEYLNEDAGLMTGEEMAELYQWLASMYGETRPSSIIVNPDALPQNRRSDGTVSDAQSVANRPDPIKLLGVEVFEK